MRPLVAVLLLASLALAGCGADSRDTDGDRLYDSVEKAGWSIQVDLMTERVERHVATDPHSDDTDGDGLTDEAEFQLPGLDPTRKDTDGDGLSDCQEALHTVIADCEDPGFGGPYDGGYDTNPAKADSDPGYSRYVNRVLGFTDHTGTLANGLAETGDGISDGEEVAGYAVTLGNGATRTVRTSPLNGDDDDDGLEDGEERDLFASDPTVPDSDGDGCSDGLDLFPERPERFQAGLGSFLLKKDGGASLRVHALVANLATFTPMEGSLRVETGQAVDLGPLQPAAGRAQECSYAPYNPWVLVEVLALDTQSSPVAALDTSSQTEAPVAAGSATRFWWNVREGMLSWDSQGAAAWPVAQGIRLEGTDARLDVLPVAS